MIRRFSGLAATLVMFASVNGFAATRGKVLLETPSQKLQLEETEHGQIQFTDQRTGLKSDLFPKRRLDYYSKFFFHDALIHNLTSGMGLVATTAAGVWFQKIVLPGSQEMIQKNFKGFGFFYGIIGFLVPAITGGVALYHISHFTLPSYGVARFPSKLRKALDEAAEGKTVELISTADVRVDSEGRIIPGGNLPPVVSRSL